MNGWADVLLLCYSRFMLGDSLNSVLGVVENAPGMVKLPPVMMEVLFVRKTNIELMIGVWYCNSLILRTAVAGTADS